MTSIARMRSIVLDTADPHGLAEFYKDMLGWEITYQEALEEGGWTTVSDGGPVKLAFQYAPDHQPPRWPDPDHPQQFHLDVTVDDVEAAEAAVLRLGATRLPGEGDDFRVYADPAGHPFCLVW
jgi:catechol 2,3-dioxygenase-like lactoylglutathione lyase family enzyme